MRLGGLNTPVPWIIDYPIVLEQMRAQKLRSVYYNSGAFAFNDDISTRTIGWVGPPDESIRAESRNAVRQIPPPYEKNLTELLIRAWREILPGRIWVMPASHWAFELDFASRPWLPAILESIGIDAGMLQTRTSAAAIEFALDESDLLEKFILRLLEMLQASDFSIAFPGRGAICLLHHHKQIWWTSAEESVGAALDAIIL